MSLLQVTLDGPFLLYSFIQIFGVSISAKDLYVYSCGYVCVCVIKEFKKKKQCGSVITVLLRNHPSVHVSGHWLVGDTKEIALPFLWAAFAPSSIQEGVWAVASGVFFLAISLSLLGRISARSVFSWERRFV